MKLNWRNTLFLTLTPIAALIWTPFDLVAHGWSWGLLLMLVVAFSISNMSITCGYHRYFSHRSYDCHPLIHFLYVIFGSGAFQGSVLEWCRDHRRHHRSVDTDRDPYSIQKGFFYAHVGWMFYKNPDESTDPFPPDLAAQKILQIQHKYYALFSTAVGFGLPLLIGAACGAGWRGLLWGGVLRVVLTQHSTFCINSLAHTLGRRPYSEGLSARDNWFASVLTFGEGYHNFHHMFQADYRNGIRWYQWDPSKWWIRALAFVGLAKKLKKVAATEILRARLARDQSVMVAKGACYDTVESLKTKMLDAQHRFTELKLQLRKKREVSQQQYRQWRIEAKQAKMEFRLACRQWAMQLRQCQIPA